MAKRGRPRKTQPVVEKPEVSNEDTQTIEVEELEPDNIVTEHIATDLKENPTPEGTSGGYNPFKENIVERDYSTPKVAEGVTDDIFEPEFRPPSYEDIIGERSETEEEELGSPFDNPNPALNDLDSADKKIACESLVDTCLDGYEQLHKLAIHFAKVNEDDLMQRQIEGKIDLEDYIPVSEDEDMTVLEFVEQYNSQTEEALKYDKEFGYKVRPAMVRVFMKKGWGMSDEQFLAYMFGRDIVTKVTMVISLKKTINNTLSMLEKAHKQNKQAGYTHTPSEIIEDEPIPEPEPTPEPEPEPESPIHIVDEVPKQRKRKEKTGKEKFNIDYPKNPTNPMAEHPTEIQDEIKKEIKGKKKK